MRWPRLPTVAGACGHMGEVHKLLTEHGKQVLLRSEVDRRVLDAAAAYMAAEEGEIGFVYAGWAQASLPHRRLADDAHWEIQTDRVSLIVQPGLRAIPGQSPVSVGVPYGSRARLIILYLQTEAIRTGSRHSASVTTLQSRMRLAARVCGKSMKDVRDQAERISRCRLTFQISTAGRSGLVNQNILDSAMFVADDSTQGNLFIETAKLSEGFFEQLQKHPVPIEEAAVRQIANNSMALDVYVWPAGLGQMNPSDSDRFLGRHSMPSLGAVSPAWTTSSSTSGKHWNWRWPSIRRPMCRSMGLPA